MNIRQRFMNLGLRRKLIAGLGLVLVATLIVTALAFRVTSGSQNALEWVDHSQAVIQQTTDLQSTIYGMQGGFRNYMITGDSAFSTAESTAETNFTIFISSLKSQTRDNPAQQERWSRIEGLVQQWQTDVVDPGFAIRDQINAGSEPESSAIAWVSQAITQNTFAVISAETNTALIDEQQLLSTRISEVQGESDTIRAILVLGSIAVLVISAATAYTITNDVAAAMRRFIFVAQRVSEGDYGQRVNLNRDDEIGRSAAAFDGMSRTLRATIADLNDVADRAQRSESQTRALLDNISEGIFTFSSSGIIDELNPAAEAMFQWDRDSIIGQPVGTIVTIGESNRVESVDGAANDRFGRRNIHHDALGHRADGVSFPVEIVITEMDVRGAPKFIGVVRNLTPLVEAERRLRIRNRELETTRSISRAVLDSTGEGVILISPQRKIVTINQRFTEFFGVREADVVDQQMMKYGELLDRIFVNPDAFRTVLYETIDDSEARHTAMISQQWPEHRELEYFTVPVKTPAGDLLGRLFAFRDVTREREVDRMKTEFVSLVSHELRTPLTSIKGYVDLLLEDEVGELEPEQREFLQIVGTNADRLVALIGELLDISRIEAGKVELSLVPNDLDGALSMLAASFRPQLEAKHQTLSVSVPEGTPPVMADTQRLNQICTNLLSNAHKYSPAGSAIEIRVGHIDGSVSIAFRDQGIGLSDSEQERLFTRFYRARNRATEEIGGSGLGLAITRSLVELHGGTITVDSAAGQGSVFTVVLPSSTAIPEEANARVAIDSRSPVSGRILIVEDEPDIANLMRRYLERAGFQVMTSSNATDAMNLVRRTRFDLITLDVMLPDGDGFQVLEDLKAEPKTHDIPVMMLSMLPDEGTGKRLGAVDYLTKPIGEVLLIEHVNFVLQASGDRSRGSILVADDDADIRGLIARNLTRAGYEVLTAANGAEAVELATNHHFDLILLDVRMPVMDGITALQELRTLDSTQNQPIVMMTASPGAVEDIQPVLAQFGVRDLLQKPLTATQLATVLERTLRELRQEKSDA